MSLPARSSACTWLQVVGALALLRSIRLRWRCSWPVEIFHLGPDEAFAPAVAAQLRSLGNVSLRDVGTTEAARWVRGVPRVGQAFGATIALSA
jgi:hypothetical protein